MTAAPAQFSAETDAKGAFVRQQYRFRDRITADGSLGYPAEAGRYHLYVLLACPWAHRAIIVRRLLGLGDVVPNLWGYARDLFQRPGFGETVDFDHIKRHYHMTHDRLNPSRIVPLGPLVDWLAPHNRARLG